MIIGVDGNEANVEERVGVSVYTLELLRYFSQKATEKLKFVIYLRNEPRKDLPEQNEHFRYEVMKSPSLWRDIFLPVKLYSGKRPNVFFSPAHYTPRFCPVPIVVTIHDLAYEYYPDEFLKKDLYQLKNWTRHAVQNASKIIAVSENTKKDIIKFYKIPEEKITVIYNGFNKFKFQSSNVKSNPKSPPKGDQPLADKIQSLESSFILYVGTIQPRKNLTTLIAAFHQLTAERGDLKLVIAGKKGWMYENIFEKVKELKLEDKVIFTGYLLDERLTDLYKKASVFVMPSLYEGFCIPVLEAMEYGCPVVSSNTSSLPEIAGNACLYFSPSDKIDLKNNILKILSDQKLRQSLVKKGRERVKKFSWEKSGRETLKILKNV